jgi:septal ring factor EnvC (AmiA/AmiB activator)
MDLQTQLKTSEIKISTLSQQIAALDQQYTQEEEQLEKLKATQQNFMKQLSRQRESLAKQIRILYFLGKTAALKTVLNPDDVDTISRHIYYYHYLSNARSELLSEINQVLTTLNENMTIITTHEKNLKKLMLQKQQEQVQQKLAQAQREKIVVQLNTQTQNQQQQIEMLSNNQKNLQAMLVDLQTQPADITRLPFNNLHGKLQWPINGARISPAQQPGVIIKAAEGTPVHAIYGGKIIFANWLRGFGLLVIINHGNGFMSLYARNHVLYAKVGDVVKPRDVIASIGNTGGFDKSSLYFEIRQNGSPVNPSIWCR